MNETELANLLRQIDSEPMSSVPGTASPVTALPVTAEDVFRRYRRRRRTRRTMLGGIATVCCVVIGLSQLQNFRSPTQGPTGIGPVVVAPANTAPTHGMPGTVVKGETHSADQSRAVLLALDEKIAQEVKKEQLLELANRQQRVESELATIQAKSQQDDLSEMREKLAIKLLKVSSHTELASQAPEILRSVVKWFPDTAAARVAKSKLGST